MEKLKAEICDLYLALEAIEQNKQQTINVLNQKRRQLQEMKNAPSGTGDRDPTDTD